MKIGFIGLGIMGKPMARNLLKANHAVVVLSTNKAAAELVTVGATSAGTPREVAAQSEMVITMLPNSPQVKDVLLGKDGVIEGARPGTVVVDMSSIAPLVAQECAKKLAEKQIEMLDAPVSGGEPKAIEGTLAVMVGGKQEIFDKAFPVLKAMAASVVRTGDIGAGNVTKLANQVIVALNIAAMSEAYVLAAKAGVNPELVFNAIKGGLAGSTVLNAKSPLIFDRNFKPGFRIKLHVKDLQNILDTSHEIGVPLPLTAAVMEMMQALKVDGEGESDHAALVKFYEKLSHVEVKR
ncbi:MAG: 2-hydroxy-3-oxopropionate reductase [Phycisphaerae bacterium]